MPEAPPPGPEGAPMAQPTPNEGSQQMGFVNAESAMQMLEQALPSLGSNTPEGAAVVKALGILSKVFQRQEAAGLIPAQIMELTRAQQPSAMQQMMGGGGAPAPGGAPAAAPMAA